VAGTNAVGRFRVTGNGRGEVTERVTDTLATKKEKERLEVAKKFLAAGDSPSPN